MHIRTLNIMYVHVLTIRLLHVHSINLFHFMKDYKNLNNFLSNHT